MRKGTKSDEIATLAQSFQEVVALVNAYKGSDGAGAEPQCANVFSDVKVASLHVLTMLDLTLRVLDEARWKDVSAFAKSASLGATSKSDHDRRVAE